jgi:hypothetical protein
MTDYLNRFGGNLAAASAGTVDFENTLDFGDIDSRSVVGTHRTGETPDETIVVASTVTTGATSIIVAHADVAGGAYTTIETLPVGTLARGDFMWIPFPKTHKRYVKLQVVSSGALAAGALSARLEPGAGAPRG